MTYAPADDEGGALERTALAWFRTASAMFLAAAVVLRSLAPHHLRPGPVAVSGALACLAAATFGYGLLRYRRISSTAAWAGAAPVAIRAVAYGTSVVALGGLAVIVIQN